MNGQRLIDAVVQQVTVLIAQLATSGGVRAPVAHIANQVFVQLARELESQGVSRRVSADMLGMALRAYQRKLTRLTEADSDPGSTLWRAALEHIRSAPLVTREPLTVLVSDQPECVAPGCAPDEAATSGRWFYEPATLTLLGPSAHVCATGAARALAPRPALPRPPASCLRAGRPRSCRRAR